MTSLDHNGFADADYRAMWQTAQEALLAANRERELLRAHGDLLQSSASRLSEWVEAVAQLDVPCEGVTPVPYEVAVAAIEARGAVEGWTDLRAAR